MLCEATSSLLKPPKWVPESVFEISWGSGENRKWYSMIVSFCRDIPEAKDMSAARHGPEPQHPSVRWHSSYENMVMGRKILSPVVVDTMEARRTVKELQREAGSPAERSSSRKRREVLDDIGLLLSKQSVAECSSFLKDVCERNEVVIENLYSVFTFKSLHNLRLGVSRLLQTFLIH